MGGPPLRGVIFGGYPPKNGEDPIRVRVWEGPPAGSQSGGLRKRIPPTHPPTRGLLYPLGGVGPYGPYRDIDLKVYEIYNGQKRIKSLKRKELLKEKKQVFQKAGG